jgi:hypothetical protein
MYYVTFTDSDGYLNISQFKFEILDEALSYSAGFSAECNAKILEEHKTISQRLVIKTKPEPVWRERAIPPEVVAWDLLPEEPLSPNGMQKLGELLRAKLNGE